MRRALALPVLLIAMTAHAQPGPSAPLELAEIRLYGTRIRDADATLRSPTTDANARLRAAYDYASALRHLYPRVSEGPAAGGPRSIAPGAERELRALTGLSFAQVAPAVPRAWERCVAEVRTLHALDDGARECLVEVTRYKPTAAARDGYVLAPPAGFVALGATPAVTQAIYRATEARVADHPDDVASRRALAAMQLATADYGVVVATLRPLAGAYDVDLTVALAVAATNDASADALLLALIHRDPSRPEAYYDRALVAYGRASSTEDHTQRGVLLRQQFEQLRAFLCTRTAAQMAGPPDVFARAARDAETTQWQALGGSHWAYQSNKPRPPPFLPMSVLPAELQDGPLPGPTASTTCGDALHAAGR